MSTIFDKRKGRPSLRDKKLAINAADRFYASCADTEPRAQNVIAPKRERAAPNPLDSEAPVVAAVGELLSSHPQVIFAVRQNSGAMAYQGKDGRSIPVWFYKIVRRRGASDMTITDFWGFLRDGRPLALECKRPSWKVPRDTRELNQQAFIHMIEALGGVGGFVRSADEAMEILKR